MVNCVSLYLTAGGGAAPAVAVVKTLGAPPQPAQNQAQIQKEKTPSSTSQNLMPTSASPPPLPAGLVTNDTLSKTTFTPSSQPSTTGIKPPPPFVLPKPQSPINVVSPMAQAPPPQVSPPVTPTKPAAVVAASVATVTSAPALVSFTPQVLQASSLSPFGDGAATPSRGTPSGRATPSMALRQGIPQKPYTFLDEKAR